MQSPYLLTYHLFRAVLISVVIFRYPVAGLYVQKGGLLDNSNAPRPNFNDDSVSKSDSLKFEDHGDYLSIVETGPDDFDALERGQRVRRDTVDQHESNKSNENLVVDFVRRAMVNETKQNTTEISDIESYNTTTVTQIVLNDSTQKNKTFATNKVKLDPATVSNKKAMNKAKVGGSMKVQQDGVTKILQEEKKVKETEEVPSVAKNVSSELPSVATNDSSINILNISDNQNITLQEASLIESIAHSKITANGSGVDEPSRMTMLNINSGYSFEKIMFISGGVVVLIAAFVGIGAASTVFYRRYYWNQPQTLNDKSSNTDSIGYLDDSFMKENSEEMYSLDNDSFLNSIEAMTIQNYWADSIRHSKF